MDTVYRFGGFELRPTLRQLLANGQPVTLGQRAFDVLHTLVEHRNRLVTKSELLDLVWPGLVVEENNLQVQISALRKVLSPQTIATVPGRGYRFTAVLDDGGDNKTEVAAPGATSAVPEIAARTQPATNLPKELPILYGRDSDLQDLRLLIGAHRLVTIVGAGGIGKSRVAQAAAHDLAQRWPDGAWMVELAGLSDPALLPNSIAQVLGITISGQGSALTELVAAAAPRNALVVLDNCEHLLDAVAETVVAIIRDAPNITILATSQEPLRLPMEQQYRLVPLAVPSAADHRNAREFGAVALFEARVRAVDRRFALNDESLELVIDICRHLDGLPLAVELAAARVATLGLRSVRDKLDSRFRLLTGGSRTTLRRHQTLRVTLEWSYNLLDEAERTVFRRLGIFSGGFTAEMAQAVAGDVELDEWTVLDLLSALVEKSLVVADTGDQPRYRLLESARAFALEHLPEGETVQIARRHALALCDFLQRVDGANLDGELRTDQYAALVLPELDNLRTAYAWATSGSGDPKVAMAIAAHAGPALAYAAEVAEWLLAQHPRVDDSAVEDIVSARYWRAIAAVNMARRVSITLQLEAARRAQLLYQKLGQPRRVFSSLIQLSRHLGEQGNLAQAKSALDEARILVRPDWPAEFRIQLLRGDATLAALDGRFGEALAACRELIGFCASRGDWRLEAIGRNSLVDFLWQVGRLEEAAREADVLTEQFRTRPAASSDMDIVFINLMGILSELGRIDEASAAARAVLPLMRRTQTYYIETWTYFFWRRGQVDTGALLLGASDADQTRRGARPQPNERRLIAAARASLDAALSPTKFATAIAAGAALDKGALPALIADALAQFPSSAISAGNQSA